MCVWRHEVRWLWRHTPSWCHVTSRCNMTAWCHWRHGDDTMTSLRNVTVLHDGLLKHSKNKTHSVFKKIYIGAWIKRFPKSFHSFLLPRLHAITHRHFNGGLLRFDRGMELIRMEWLDIFGLSSAKEGPGRIGYLMVNHKKVSRLSFFFLLLTNSG